MDDHDTSTENFPSGAIQIVNVTGTKNNMRLELDETALEKILMDESIRDKPVAVISINGKLREGKSFLLNLLLQHLEKKANPTNSYAITLIMNRFTEVIFQKLSGYLPQKYVDHVAGQVDDTFKWKNSMNLVTKGIYMWHKPILVKEADGTEVAVLLVDTHGLFDDNMPAKFDSFIFVLSSIISSHQLAVQYAKYVIKQRNVAPFQKLKFLVRDWVNFHEYPFGLDGGKKYLNDVPTHMSMDAPNDSKSVQDLILSCYKEYDCYLFPFPGAKVASDSKYNGNVADIDVEFINHTEQLADLLFDPKNLQIKTINDVMITCKDLMDTIKGVFCVLQDEKLLETKLLFEATAEVSYNKVLENVLNDYDVTMASEFEKWFSETDELQTEDELFVIHEKLVIAASLDFSSCHKIKFQDLEQQYNSQLFSRIQERFDYWRLKFRQAVILNLHNFLKKYELRSEDDKIKTKTAKVGSEQFREDLDEKRLQQIKQLVRNSSLEIEKSKSDKSELQELRTLLKTYKRKLKKLENKIKQIKMQYQEEAERLVAMTTKLEELTDENNRLRLSTMKDDLVVAVTEAATAISEAKDELSNNKKFVEDENDMSDLSKIINQDQTATVDSQMIDQKKVTATGGYPQVNKQCIADDDHIIDVPCVPGLKLTIPKQCLTDDVSITLTVYYLDPPYRYGLQLDDDEHLIYLTPIVRLEPDGYQFNGSQSFNVMLQLPIPCTNLICQHFRIDDIGDLALQLAQRSHSDSEWRIENIANQPTTSIIKTKEVLCISVPIYHFSDYFIYVKSIYSFVSEFMYPALQQNVIALAYLSRIDWELRETNLKIFLIRSDINKTKIEKIDADNSKAIPVSCDKLKETILENGLYKIEFNPCGLACKHDEFSKQNLKINWNENKSGCYELFFKCKIQPLVDLLVMIADIIIKPIGNQKNRDSKFLSFIMPESSHLSSTPSTPATPIKDEMPVDTVDEIVIAQLQQVLDNNYGNFFRFVPVDEILNGLLRNQILSSDDVTNIKNKTHKKDRIELLFNILRNHRLERDLLTFCQLLQKHGVLTIQNFGKELEKEIKLSRS